MGVRGNNNIKLIKTNKNLDTTININMNVKPNINSPFYIPSIYQRQTTPFYLNNTLLDNLHLEDESKIQEAIELWKTLLPVPEDINEFELMTFIYDLVQRDWAENSDRIWLVNDIPFSNQPDLTEYLINKGLLISDNTSPTKNTQVRYSPKFQSFVSMVKYHEPTIPFSDYVEKTKTKQHLTKEYVISHLFRNNTEKVRIKIDQEEYLVELKLQGSYSEQEILSIISDEVSKLSGIESSEINYNELRLQKPELLKELSSTIKDIKSAKLILEPYAVTKDNLLFYGMEDTNAVYVSLPKDIVFWLNKKYGNNLEFRLKQEDQNEDHSQGKINIINNNKLVASVYPTDNNIVRPYSYSRYFIDNDFLRISKIFRTIELIKDKGKN